MRIIKTLNNNVAIARNDQHEEVIVLGNGIAFGKRAGDEIDESCVTRVFTQQPPGELRRITELLSDLPEEYIDAAVRIVESAKIRLGREFGGNLYFALADHLHFTIERARRGMLIQNRLLLETKIIYRDEFQAAAEATRYLSKRFDIDLPEDEAAFIALHFVNATLGASMQDTYDIANVVKDIYAIIRNWMTITLDEESLSWYRLMVHVKFFAQRLVLKQMNDDPRVDDAWLLGLVRKQYPGSLECAERIARYLAQKYHFTVPDSEKAYLAIHIEHVNHGLCEGQENRYQESEGERHGDVG